MSATSVRIGPERAVALLLILAAVAVATDQSTLQPAKQRKPAASFALKDGSGATVKLEEYRGKVVLLDFWATWCTGCKQEIPWFSQFQKTYASSGFAMIGVSLDEGGWRVLRPFLAANKVPYEMLLGNEATAQSYGIASLPDTFLIDREGRVAAAYRARLVDKDEVEVNIKALLSQR